MEGVDCCYQSPSILTNDRLCFEALAVIVGEFLEAQDVWTCNGGVGSKKAKEGDWGKVMRLDTDRGRQRKVYKESEGGE